MKLYCQNCREVHDFKGSEIEQLIYGLHAQSLELIGRGCTAEKDAKYWCLKDTLNLVTDVEMYWEEISWQVEARRKGSK